jgi:hypothetical protein
MMANFLFEKKKFNNREAPCDHPKHKGGMKHFIPN